MLLDDIQNFINEYHIIGIGIGCFVTAAAITLLLKTVFGRWKWQKDKTPLRGKKTVDQFRMEQAEN